MTISGMSSFAQKTGEPAAAWYPDPADSRSARWWDGAGWTGHTRELAPSVRIATVTDLPTRRSLREAQLAQ